MLPAGWTEITALVAAYLIAALATPAGISGAVLLLPFQVSILGTPSPSVTPTNLRYNVIATPGALYQYLRQGQAALITTPRRSWPHLPRGSSRPSTSLRCKATCSIPSSTRSSPLTPRCGSLHATALSRSEAVTIPTRTESSRCQYAHRLAASARRSAL